MSFMLSQSVSFCEIDGQRVFLDLVEDRYFGLSDTGNASFTKLITGACLTAEDQRQLARLEQTGVLRSTADKCRPTPCAAHPASSAILDQRVLPAASVYHALCAALALRRAKRQVGRVPLDRLCNEFRNAKREAQSRNPPADDRVDVRLAVAFQTAARLVGALDQCLALSFALGRSASAAGLPTDLLLGVRLRPFHAHAWIQVDGVILSDQFDNIRPYTPILVL